MKKLNYVFKVSVLSCKDDGSWVERAIVKQRSEDCINPPQVIAGNIASHHYRPGETGVKVEFLGLQEQVKSAITEPPITPLNNFTLTLIREPFTP